MTGPPDRGAAPGLASGSGGVEAAASSNDVGTIPPTTDQDTNPHCWLCPLPKCGYPDCRVEVVA